MQLYKHYSFDLWLTLIRSNPAFKSARAKVFQEKYNFSGKSLKEVETIFRQVDLMCNSMNEKTGKNIDADEMYLMVISLLNDFNPSFAHIDIKELEMEMEALIFNYLPVLYCGDTAGKLAILKDNGTATLSLLSNTGFIRGRILRKVLKELELDQYLDFQLYSDEERLSKPNPDFFQLMLNRIDRKRHRELELHEVVHIGDNPHADIHGASAVGIHSVLINSNHLTISCL